MPFDIAQSFMERSARATTTQALAAAFQDATHRLGFRYFACASHVSLSNPPPGSVQILNYPDAWVRIFMARRLEDVDPVLRFAEHAFLPFFWDTPEFRHGLSVEQTQILSEAATMGIDHGWTVPLYTPLISMRASCSLIPDSKSISSQSYLAMQTMAAYLHGTASRLEGAAALPTKFVELSKRERECLEYAAQGKTDWEIGQILNLSEHTVRRYFETAKRRLGVFTRVQAVILALQQRQISFGDAIRALPAKDQPNLADSRSIRKSTPLF